MPGGENDGASGSSSGTSSSSGGTSVALDDGYLKPFSPKGEPHSLSQRWKKCKRAFNLYVTGKGVSDDAQQRALFLNIAGMDDQVKRRLKFLMIILLQRQTFILREICFV